MSTNNKELHNIQSTIPQDVSVPGEQMHDIMFENKEQFPHMEDIDQNRPAVLYKDYNPNHEPGDLSDTFRGYDASPREEQAVFNEEAAGDLGSSNGVPGSRSSFQPHYSNRKEIWKEVPDIHPDYQLFVSSHGRVKTKIKSAKNKKGRNFICIGGQYYPLDILVATMFNRNPTLSEFVIHSDGDMGNDNPDSLVWVPNVHAREPVIGIYNIRNREYPHSLLGGHMHAEIMKQMHNIIDPIVMSLVGYMNPVQQKLVWNAANKTMNVKVIEAMRKFYPWLDEKKAQVSTYGTDRFIEKKKKWLVTIGTDPYNLVYYELDQDAYDEALALKKERLKKEEMEEAQRILDGGTPYKIEDIGEIPYMRPEMYEGVVDDPYWEINVRLKMLRESRGENVYGNPDDLNEIMRTGRDDFWKQKQFVAGADERKSAVKKSREISAEVMRRRMDKIQTGKVDISDWGSIDGNNTEIEKEVNENKEPGGLNSQVSAQKTDMNPGSLNGSVSKNKITAGDYFSMGYGGAVVTTVKKKDSAVQSVGIVTEQKNMEVEDLKKKYGYDEWEGREDNTKSDESEEESVEEKDRRVIESMGYEMPDGLPERFSMHTNKERNDYETKVIMERERLKRNEQAAVIADARKQMDPWNGKAGMELKDFEDEKWRADRTIGIAPVNSENSNAVKNEMICEPLVSQKTRLDIYQKEVLRIADEELRKEVIEQSFPEAKDLGPGKVVDLSGNVKEIKEVPHPELLANHYMKAGLPKKRLKVPVVCTLPNGREIIFPGILEAAAATGGSPIGISKCCKGEQQRSNGMKFRFCSVQNGPLDEYIMSLRMGKMNQIYVDENIDVKTYDPTNMYAMDRAEEKIMEQIKKSLEPKKKGGRPKGSLDKKPRKKAKKPVGRPRKKKPGEKRPVGRPRKNKE